MPVQVYHGIQKGTEASKRNTYATLPNNCIYRMAALFCASMQKVTMKYAKNILQLLEQGQ